jgi:hypothetical protein
VELSARGTELAALIDIDPELMSVEKAFLRNLAPLNESSILRRMGGKHVDA